MSWGYKARVFGKNRPYIGVDGCHLRDPYKGQLPIAIGVDGNNNSYALAYVVVKGETNVLEMVF